MHGNWRKDGRCRNGKHVIAEVGVYTSNGVSTCRGCAMEVMARSRAKHRNEINARRNAKWKAMTLDERRAMRDWAHKHLKRTYGITHVEYDAMFAAQNGLCAVCGNPETMVLRGRLKRLGVDHDHNSGQVRGLLCHKCNIAVGHLDDSVDRAYAVVAYLEKFIKEEMRSTGS